MHIRRDTKTSLLLLPSSAIYTALFLAPIALLVRTSLLPEGPGAPLEGPLSLSSYADLADPYYGAIFIRTVRIAALTTLFCLLLGYPLAYPFHGRGERGVGCSFYSSSPRFSSRSWCAPMAGCSFWGIEVW